MCPVCSSTLLKNFIYSNRFGLAPRKNSLIAFGPSSTIFSGSDNRIGDEGAVALAGILEKSLAVTTVNLGGVQIDSVCISFHSAHVQYCSSFPRAKKP